MPGSAMTLSRILALPAAAALVLACAGPRAVKPPGAGTEAPDAAFRGAKPLPSAAHAAVPPLPGDRWRFNLFRIERPGGPQAPEKDVVAVAWSPTGEPSFHVPRAFRDLVFAGAR